MSSETIDHGERAHSEIGASSASRWLACPASVIASRGIAEKGSTFAAEGTAAHELSEHCFENNVEAYTCVGQEFNGFIVTTEMAGHVQYYLDNMKRFTLSDEYDVTIEERFELPKIHKDMFGSNDFCATGINNGRLVIADFKYGAGLNVNAEKNIQLIIYALGAYYASNFIYDFKEVSLIVVQPRMEGNEWSQWNITIDELLAYEQILIAGVTEVYSESPKYDSGEHCRFCKAKATCPLLKGQTEDLIQQSFAAVPFEEKPKLPEIKTLDNDTIVKVLKHSKQIENWFKAVSAHAYEMLENGEELEGYKLVKSKSNRKFIDEGQFIEDHILLEASFEDSLFAPKKLLALGKLEKLIGKAELAPYLYKPDAGNTIAPISDKRAETPNRKDLTQQAFAPVEEFNDMEF
jgi:hypothetical protein